MPEQRQIMLTTLPVPNKSKGARKELNLRNSFPDSPIFKNEITDDERKVFFQEKVLDATIIGGNGFNSVNLNYVDSPNLEEVETGGGGLPASPYMPNLTSPGPGSFNAADQPVFNGEIIDKNNRNNWGTGLGSVVSPSQTSKEIGKFSILKSYISGRSYQGSDGKS